MTQVRSGITPGWLRTLVIGLPLTGRKSEYPCAIPAWAEGIADNPGMNETAITSRENPIFRRLKKLAGSARARREARMTLLDGEHLIAAYLDAGGQPNTLVRSASSQAGRQAALVARCSEAKSIVLPDALFAELAPVATPAGILAEAAWLNPPTIDATALVIVLENIQDPGNLGAMLRTGASGRHVCGAVQRLSRPLVAQGAAGRTGRAVCAAHADRC